jgi:hypothetical protein
MSFWKIYHEKKTILENFQFYGNISMEIGIVGKFPWIYGTTVCLEVGGGR